MEKDKLIRLRGIMEKKTVVCTEICLSCCKTSISFGLVHLQRSRVHWSNLCCVLHQLCYTKQVVGNRRFYVVA